MGKFKFNVKVTTPLYFNFLDYGFLFDAILK